MAEPPEFVSSVFVVSGHDLLEFAEVPRDPRDSFTQAGGSRTAKTNNGARRFWQAKPRDVAPAGHPLQRVLPEPRPGATNRDSEAGQDVDPATAEPGITEGCW